MDFSFLKSESGSFWEKGEAGDEDPSWTLQEDLLLESQALGRALLPRGAGGTETTAVM